MLPASTQKPANIGLPTFQSIEDDDTLGQLLQYLRTVSTKDANHIPDERRERRKQNNKSPWLKVILGLADSILPNFPLPDGIAWTVMKENIHLVEATLGMIHRIFTEVGDLYEEPQMDLMAHTDRTTEQVQNAREDTEKARGELTEEVKKLFHRLLEITFVLGLWMDVEGILEEGLPSPIDMKNNAMKTLVAMLRGLGNSRLHVEVPDIATSPDSQAFIRIVIQEVVELHQSLTLSVNPIAFPSVVAIFEAERVRELQGDPSDLPSYRIILYSPSHVIVFLSTAMQALLSLTPTSLVAGPFLAERQRVLLENVKALFDYCLSPSCCCTNIGRTRALANIYEAVLEFRTESHMHFQYMQQRLLQCRLQGVLTRDVSSIDALLKQSFELGPRLPSRVTVFQALGHLNGQNHIHEGTVSLARSYLQNCLLYVDKELLPVVQKHMQVPPDIGTAVVKKQPQLHTPPKLSMASPVRLNLKDHVWRWQVKELVHKIIEPDCLEWMDDDFRPNEMYTIRRVLDDVSDRFTRPLLHADEKSRLKLAQDLAKLPCLLSLCAGTDCTTFRSVGGPELVRMYMPAVEVLLEGSEDEVTPAVRRAMFSAMTYILKHRNEEQPDEGFLSIIFQGLMDRDRGTRIRAGSTIPAITQVYSTDTPESRSKAVALFDRLYQFIESNKPFIKETVLLSIVSMGNTTDAVILGHTLCLYITQLGHDNILLRSLACTRILKLAKFHNKSPYSLFQPHMDQVAPLVFSRLSSQPTLLNEMCRLISMAPPDFISINLSRTVPEVLVRSDSKALDLIASHLGRPRHSLIVGDNLHLNLAPIFLLSSSALTNKALNFILGILNEVSNSKIDLPQVLPGCTTTLLTELVTTMGDEHPHSIEAATAAIRKVETALKTGKSRNSQDANPSTFLASQMLAIISRIIDMLQDVHGKKSVSAKQKIIRSLGVLITLIGAPIHSVSSQIMATFQTTLSVSELAEITLESWHSFLITVVPSDLGPHLGSTCAAFLASWSALSDKSHKLITESLQYTFNRFGASLVDHLDDIPDLSIVDELRPLQAHLSQLHCSLPPKESLERLLSRCTSSNLTVATLSLDELKRAMQSNDQGYIQSLASGDVFDPMIGEVVSTLFAAACRDGDGIEPLRLLAYECIGILGAIDPYRFELPVRGSTIVVSKNYMDESETVKFVLHLIENLLVDTFRSTSDIKYQTNLAYPIQELLKYCGFSSDLVNSGRAVPMKIRNRWAGLKKDVLDVVTPLLEGRFTFHQHSIPDIRLPIYQTQSTYREWLQLWVTHLLSKASGDSARRIFGVFLSVVRSKDVVIARHLLPHVVLNVLISGNPDDGEDIRSEIRAVLEDQVDSQSNSTTDKKLLSAQAIFALLDHLNRWARAGRREIHSKKSEVKRARTPVVQVQLEEQLLRLDSVVSNIDLNLMANAAFRCKAYARALMSFEQQITMLKEQKNTRNLEIYYDTIHEIYAHLDEPDGMEGVSTLIMSPSLEHQIREHESTGRWTAAQSCWEVRLQQSPNKLEFHQGLLRCLRNLGHYDTLRNHVKGVLTDHPEWESDLADFHVESSWMVGAWEDVDALVKKVDIESPSIMIANVLLAMRSDDPQRIASTLATARNNLGAPINAAGINGYVRAYGSVLHLHHLHELEAIHLATKSLSSSPARRKRALNSLSTFLTSRLGSVLPTYRNLEPILSMRRVGFSIVPRPDLACEVGKSWLTSAKFSRKAGHWQTAYSAMLQGRQSGAQFYFVESVKLMKASGEPLKALHELEMFMNSLGLSHDSNVLDLTIEEEVTSSSIKPKLNLLHARWMNESERFEASVILEAFRHATELDKKLESSHFYFGNFYDSCCRELDSREMAKRGLKMHMYTIRNYTRAIRYGSKYIYQTVPRLLTLWLDYGEDKSYCGTDVFNKINEIVSNAIREIPAFKWFTAFPQIVSRVGHPTDKVYDILSQLIVSILQEHPNQGLWQFAAVVKSTKHIRSSRGKQILDRLRSSPSSIATLPKLIATSVAMCNELLSLCDLVVNTEKMLSISKSFPRLKDMSPNDLIIPVLGSLTASLPSSSSTASTHQPFPPDAPTFNEFYDEIEIMKSMAKPRKITILGSDGQEYMFLCKPKDDLRKDARLMDFNTIINKLLKAHSDARRRQLHIRTYGVITLNEECGIIQWVPNTSPIRPILLKYYEARRIRHWSSEVEALTNKIKDQSDSDAGKTFVEKLLPIFPPVFHEWFIETFPEPTAWLESRSNYGRTAAVMSMVGYILGLGDRHCENILLDIINGDVVHVDFNCLFEKGKQLQTPERVPFRLTQNIVDGLGITGVEGIFRISCELTMDVLRQDRHTLMTVLDAFIHDPLVEWEDEKRKLDRNRNNRVANTTINIAKGSLEVIRKKFEGAFTTFKAAKLEAEKNTKSNEKKLSTKNLVELLIEEATSSQNLSKMYPGWAPWN